MTKIASAKDLGPNASKARGKYKKQLKRLRRRQEKLDPENAIRRNREGFGGYAS